MSNKLISQTSIGLHRILEETSLQLSACLIDQTGKPSKTELELQIRYFGPGQLHLERMVSTDTEMDMIEDDQRALYKIERNIRNIERSMSTSQLDEANNLKPVKDVSIKAIGKFFLNINVIRCLEEV